MSVWSLIYNEFDPEEEKLREALCTLGNGYFATRGAAFHARAGETHYPGTYLAGGYNRLKTRIKDRDIENEDLVNMPNWLCLSFRYPGMDWFDLPNVDILDYRQELNMKEGLLLRRIRFQDSRGQRSVVNERRMAHMRDSHMAALEVTFTPENWSGEIEFCTALDGTIVNDGVERYRGLSNEHLEPLETMETDSETIYLKVRTNQSKLTIAQAARTSIRCNGDQPEVQRKAIRKTGYIAQHFKLKAKKGSDIRLEKIVALYSSRDTASAECGLEARNKVRQADNFSGMLKTHTLAWKHLWRRFSVEYEEKEPPGEDRTGMILHLHTFHLIQTASISTLDLDVGVPARGWHGEAYRGHIFWDELFIFPSFNLRIPEITRTLLMYRYRRLNKARDAAREAGFKGAMYPWQSGSNGREETQKMHLNPESGRWIPDNSRNQRHVNSAIVYNICKYYQATRDMEFLSFYGAEMVLEIARFWADITSYNSELDRYEIHGVMGPDEYHEAYPDAGEPGLSNNAYTNVMAAWVFMEALEILDILPEDRKNEIFEMLSLREEEIRHWKDISRKLRLCFHDDGIISQFEGYDQLEEFDWEGYREKYGDIQRLDRILEAEDDTPDRYKASKQADVLMLFYLFSADELRKIFKHLDYSFEYETIPKNIDYYIKRTSHGSTLSWIVHSWVLARSDRARSWELFEKSLESDISDIQGGTTAEGIHLGAMAGCLNILQICYTGLETRGDILWFSPCLPQELGRLNMQVHYRGHNLSTEIFQDKLRITTCRAVEKPIKIGYKEDIYELEQGKTLEINLVKQKYACKD